MLVESEKNNAETYDFVHPEHKIKSDWPVLNLISMKLASELELSLTKRFQFPIAVSSQVAQTAKSQDSLAAIDDAKLLYEVSLPPLLGNAWVTVDRALVYELAETFFGGKSDAEKVSQNTVMSHTEKRLCQYFMNCLQESLPLAWDMILELRDPVIEGISLDRLQNSFGDLVTVVNKYEVAIAEAKFELQLIYSHDMLEPHQKLLQKVKQQSTAETLGFSDALKTELMNCEIDMHAVLAETKISLAEFLELKPGDFIPLREIEHVSFKSSSKALFDARVGKSNGQVSASLSRWCTPGVS